MSGFKLLTPPAAEPVTLDEIRAQARIDSGTDDALLSTLITAARLWAEEYTGRAFVNQSWRLSLDLAICDMLGRAVALPRPPLVSITGVTVYDDADTGTPWPAGNYYADTAREPGRLVLRLGATWPVPARAVNGIVVDYTAGYGANGTDVPEPLRLGIRQLVSHWYEHRGEASAATNARSAIVAPVPLVIQALFEPYRIRSLSPGGRG